MTPQGLDLIKKLYTPDNVWLFPHEASNTIAYLVDYILDNTPAYSNFNHGHATGADNV